MRHHPVEFQFRRHDHCPNDFQFALKAPSHDPFLNDTSASSRISGFMPFSPDSLTISPTHTSPVSTTAQHMRRISYVPCDLHIILSFLFSSHRHPDHQQQLTTTPSPHSLHIIFSCVDDTVFVSALINQPPSACTSHLVIRRCVLSVLFNNSYMEE
jgi:hypothetical protein